MDEEISIINNTTRNEKIKNFFINNKKKLIYSASLILILIIGYFAYSDFLIKKKINLSNKYNKSLLNFVIEDKSKVKMEMIEIINKKDKTYSPLALYFLIDNNILKEKNKINQFFDVIINETNLEKEIKDLVIYKKALFNSDFVTENELLIILKPIINTESFWKSHAFYLLAEYFYFKNEKQKAKEFFEKILLLESSNLNIKIEAQKRLNRDFSE